MNKYHLLISDEAKLDILDTHSWYQLHQFNLGHEFIANLDAAFTLLIQKPHSFQTKYKQIRICYLARFPFGIHYLIDNEVVKVLLCFTAVEIQKIGEIDYNRNLTFFGNYLLCSLCLLWL